MKKCIILLLFVVPLVTKAQNLGFYFSGGYNFTVGSYENMNYLINRFNSYHLIQTKMGNINYFHGGGVGVGMNLWIASIRFDYNYRGNSSSGSYTNPLTLATDRKDLRVRYHTLTISPAIQIKRSGIFRPAVGCGFDMAFLDFSSRTYSGAEKTTGKFERLGSSTEPHYSNLNFMVNPFIDFRFQFDPIRLGFSIKPYYMIGVRDFDLIPVSRDLNGILSAADDPLKLQGKMSGFGIEARLIIPIWSK
jgi:hypothetical protein